MVIGRTRHPAGKGGDEAGELSFRLDFDAPDDPAAEEAKKKAAREGGAEDEDDASPSAASMGPDAFALGADFELTLSEFTPPPPGAPSNAPAAKPFEPPPPSDAPKTAQEAPHESSLATPFSALSEESFTLSLGSPEEGAGPTSIGEAHAAPATRSQEPQGLDEMPPLDLGTPGEGNAREAASFEEIAKFVDATDGLLSVGSADEDKVPADSKPPSDADPQSIDTGLRDFSVGLGAAGDFESNAPPHGDVSLPEAPESVSTSRLELGESGEAFSVPAAAEKDQFLEEVLSLATGLSRAGGLDVGEPGEGGDAPSGDFGSASSAEVGFAETEGAGGTGETPMEEARLQAEAARARAALGSPPGEGTSVVPLEGNWGAKISTDLDAGKGGASLSSPPLGYAFTVQSPAPASLRTTLKSAETQAPAPVPHWQGGADGSNLGLTQATPPMNDAPVLAPSAAHAEPAVRAAADVPLQRPTPFQSSDSAGAATVPLFGQANNGLGEIGIPAYVPPEGFGLLGAAPQAGAGLFGAAPTSGRVAPPSPAQAASPSAPAAAARMGSDAPQSLPVIDGIKKIIFRAKNSNAPAESQSPASGVPGVFGPPMAAGDFLGAQSDMQFPEAVSQAHQAAKSGFFTRLRRTLSFGSGSPAMGGAARDIAGAGKESKQRSVLIALMGAVAVVGGGTYVLADPELGSSLGLEDIASSLGLEDIASSLGLGGATPPEGASKPGTAASDASAVDEQGEASESAESTGDADGAEGEKPTDAEDDGSDEGETEAAFAEGGSREPPSVAVKVHGPGQATGAAKAPTSVPTTVTSVSAHKAPPPAHSSEKAITTKLGVPAGRSDATATAHGHAAPSLPEIEAPGVRVAARGTVFEEIPAYDFALLGKNGSFFKGIEEAILRGDFVLAMRRFSATPPQKPEQPLEMLAAKELLTRFYLGVSNVERATSVLKAECRAPGEENAHACIHYIRALVSAGRGAEARGWLQRARAETRGDWSKMAIVLSLMDAGERALALPTPQNVMALVEHYLTQPNVTTEWHLQRSIWIVRAVARLAREERLALAKTILVDRRVEFDAVLLAPERSYNRGADPLLIPYLNFLASEFEYRPLDGPRHARGRGETDVTGASILFDALMRTFVEPSQNVLSSLVSLRGREAFAGAMRVMQVNLLIQDNDIAGAAQTLQTQRNATAPGAPFRYEWALAQARYATLTGSAGLWIDSLRTLLQAARDERGAELDFDYWIVQARLLRYLRKEPSFAIRRAGGLALTPRQKGLVEVEEALVMKAVGQKAEAFAKLQAAIRTYPHHGPLLQAAAELAGQAGSDPIPYIEKQASIPEAFLRRSQEFSPLSDVTLLKLLDKI